MSLNGFPWAAMMAMQLQRSSQIAWFVYGWIEREHVLNATACADWWMRATGSAAARIQPSRQGIETTLPPLAARMGTRSDEQAESARVRSPELMRPRS